MNIKEYKNQLKLELNEYKHTLKEKLNEYKEKLNLKLKKFKKKEDKKTNKNKKKRGGSKGTGFSSNSSMLSPISISSDIDKNIKLSTDNKDCCDDIYNSFMTFLKNINGLTLDQFLQLLNNINKILSDKKCNKKITFLEYIRYLGKKDNQESNIVSSSSSDDDDSSPDGDKVGIDNSKNILSSEELIGKLGKLGKLEESEKKLLVELDYSVKKGELDKEEKEELVKGLKYFVNQIIFNE